MSEIMLKLDDVALGYDDKIIMEHISFEVAKGEVWGILGQSGCGKSTLLKNIIGLYQPMHGSIYLMGKDICTCSEDELSNLMEKIGVTYQSGALLGSLTVAENVALPLEEHTDKTPEEINQIVMQKLQLVELEKFADFMPAEISGGMKKRAGLARALALNPELLFFDEPSAGLDPLSSAELDQILLNLKNHHNATIVMVTHELDSIFTVTDKVAILDKNIKTIAAYGDPRDLAVNSDNRFVRDFLTRKSLKR